MKLLRLELAAFGPFRDRFEIDFASFDADGLYLIAGPTGAGKSTILDAIAYALYGSAPRYAGAPHVRSDLAGPAETTWVELELAVGDRILRMRRTPEYERPKLRGSGLTRERATATLWELRAGAWETLATSVDDASTEIGRILGLRKDEFLQVILLAQGGFAEFLQADSKARKALLERLFGTGSMRRLRELLLADARAVDAEREQLERMRDDRAARVREAAASLCADDGTAAAADDEAPGADDEAPTADDGGPPAAGGEAELAALEAAIAAHVDRCAARAATAAAAEGTARSARDAALAVLERIARRDAAAAALARLADAAPSIEADRARLADADRAAEVAGALERWTRADIEVETAAVALREATATLPEGVEPQRDAVEVEHDVAAEAAALAAETRRVEHSLPELERAAQAASSAASEAAEAVADAKRARAAAPAARQALIDASAAAGALASGADAAAVRVAAARERVAAREAADALAEPIAAAQASAARTAAAQREAAEEVHRLQAARVDGMAGELASTLADGEPCPVCGAVEHPSPHAAAPEAVTADDVAAAFERSTLALAAAGAANDALVDLERQRAGHLGRCGDADRASLDHELDRAAAALRDAETAIAARDAAARELAEHDEEAALLDRRIAELERDAEVRAGNAAAAGARLDESRARLEHGLRGHPDAASLLAATSSVRDALRGWLDADAEAARARAEQSAAAAAGTAALAAHDLPGRDATAAMRLERAVRAATRERVTAHDEAVAEARGVLAQPDLADLGEPPELEPLEAALREASTSAAQAARASAAAETTRGLAAADLAAARDAIASLADGAEHAATVRALARALDGKNERAQDIETYVLATRLATIIEAANARLAAMTGGRFTLVHDEERASHGKASGLGIAVVDAHTGVARTTRSLSGGETFLASLSLALGLADVVQAEAGGVSLETLFVDEGFGSLDQDTLEAAMATLDELRVGGRSVGVISHVQQMQERIPSRIRVVPVPGGGSRIVVTGSDALGDPHNGRDPRRRAG
ncbi:AAA family ATPase [Agrococcus sp. ProA11]|uniref:AAA family ATPase n=1 Tax=Agrococcus chionoecetis TaxID=3153752 RepID=UPI0032617429